jgi:hypothetical protein
MKTAIVMLILLLLSVFSFSSCWDKNSVIINDRIIDAPLFDDDNFMKIGNDHFTYVYADHKLKINFMNGMLIERVKVTVTYLKNDNVYNTSFISSELPRELLFSVPVFVNADNVSEVELFVKSLTVG